MFFHISQDKVNLINSLVPTQWLFQVTFNLQKNKNNLAHKDEIAFLFTSAEKNDVGDNQCKICT